MSARIGSLNRARADPTVSGCGRLVSSHRDTRSSTRRDSRMIASDTAVGIAGSRIRSHSAGRSNTTVATV